ncbi:MAG: SOS response-associated peptidase [Chloroflexi bacterium]|nr:SOS response-associated peptidase [Chloroflexota bacterium]
MCGRFVLINSSDLRIRFRALVQDGPDPRIGYDPVLTADERLVSRYNVAPAQQVVTVTSHDGRRRLEWMRWGLIPYWAKADDLPRNTINARADRLSQSGIWKRPLARSRCLIPADGYYEWTGPKTSRRPLLFRRRDGGLFALAGLFDRWTDPDGKVVRSCAIVTTAPNSLAEKIHDRMPAMLSEEAESLWLDPQTEDSDRLLALLGPYLAEMMESYPVSMAVNSAANESPELVARSELAL